MAADIPEYAPGKPTKDIIFQNTSIFEAKVAMPHLDQSWHDTYEIVLGIEIAFQADQLVSFETFLNLPGVSKDTPVTENEFVGSFVEEIGSGTRIEQHTVMYGIGDKIIDLGLSDQPSILVCLVRSGYTDSAITIKNMSIDLQPLDE